jgi:predicted phage terminase large subunit-like protein
VKNSSPKRDASPLRSKQTPQSTEAKLARLAEIRDELARLDAAARYDWTRNARPEQLQPAGEWRRWLLLAGRGFGKTRVLSETLRAWATSGRYRRIALVARTAADVRDVLVEGQSGILAVSPDGERPVWEPSRRRLTWPTTGTIATTYSAEEPDQLRGPQHDAAIADELCLVAGTMVTTPSGDVPIESIRPGMMVATRSGPRAVVRAWRTSDSAEVWELRTDDGRSLRGTAKHPVFTRENGFVSLSCLPLGAMLEAWDKRSNGAATDGIGTAAATIRTATESSCTARCGRAFTGRSRGASTFITATKTPATTASKTSSRSAARSTSPRTALAGFSSGHPHSGPSRCAVSGPCAPRRNASASAAAARSTRPQPSQSGVARSATTPLGTLFTQSRSKAAIISGAPPAHALRVAQSSRLATRAPSHARARAASPTSARVASITRLPDRAAVFNIEVEGAHEYFANGILTHNCAWSRPDAWDQLMMGLRLGVDPRVVVATTPRPTPLIRSLLAAEGTVVTRGATRDNLANLAPGVVADLERRYAGTRLGRQELDGEILDDSAGALWRWQWIDAARVTRAPDLRRVVVAIDPAASSHDESDETGIVVAGVGHDGRAYVLADASGRYRPEEWARTALALYREHKADCIVAEANNGGEMVAATLRVHDRGANVRTVHATRGKATRAEPVAALYEQGRASHVGALARLEDQLTTWDPATSRASPDRLDALVWALTEVMLTDAAPRFATEDHYDF